MAQVTKKTAYPFYMAALVWLIGGFLFPLHSVMRFLLVGIASVCVFVVTDKIHGEMTVELPDPPAQPVTTGNEELDKMIRDGELAISEMRRLNEAILDEEISKDIDRLEDLSRKIFEQVRHDPTRLSQIRKFMDYYLPMTLKLLNAYDRMGTQGISGENISTTMQRVEKMMKTIVAAFEKQLDVLFGAQAMDISTDITVLENMMEREGLLDTKLHTERTASDDDGIALEL